MPLSLAIVKNYEVSYVVLHIPKSRLHSGTSGFVVFEKLTLSRGSRVG